MMEKGFNALIAIILGGIVLGALSIQFFGHETPCPLCYLQRLAMLGIATSLLMNIKLELRKSHYGLGLLFCLYGGFVALRQMALHACPGFPKFGIPFWGLSLYTWSFITFAASVLAIGILLIVFDLPLMQPLKQPLKQVQKKKLPWWALFAFAIVAFDAIINVIAIAMQCGIGSCE